MSHKKNEDVPSLVILPRPQISVELNQHDEIVINTASINDAFDGITHDEIVIPLESAKEVADAMLAILKARGG